jgi:CBS domain-containing protein
LSAIHASQLSFFAAHAPFDRMERTHLLWLLERLRVAYYAKGEVIAGPGQGVAERYFIIKQGLVQGERQDSADDAVFELHDGESFPVGALLTKRAVTSVYRAAEDVFCFELSAEDFRNLLELSLVFKDFCTRRIAALFEQSNQAIQARFTQAASEQQSLSSPLSAVIRRAPVTCTPDTPLHAALGNMRDARVGAIVVVDERNKPLGIFTLPDLLTRVVLPGLSTERPISEAMSREPVSLPPNAMAYEAAMAMARVGFRHVLVTGVDGTLQGILSERDLFSLQRVGLRQISNALRHAENIQALVVLSKDIRKMIHSMMAQGVAAEQLTLFISTLNDLLAERLIELECTSSGLPDTPLYEGICWLVMGSGGRFEQTLNTDQDNAVIFTVPEGMTADQVRAQLLPVALRINQALALCGFPLCKGNIMASNPKWCLSLDEWKEVFDKWVDQGSTEALLHASIFFDFRALAGQHRLAEELRNWLARLARGNSRFLHQMAANALRNRPPLGLVRDFVLNDSNRLDLKINGLIPFVDAARIFSLATGVTQTSTIQRLRQSAAGSNIPPTEVEAWINAFLFIQMLRLRHHYEANVHQTDVEAQPLDNLIDPSLLNELDRRILKESFRQARKAQVKLALDYQL